MIGGVVTAVTRGSDRRHSSRQKGMVIVKVSARRNDEMTRPKALISVGTSRPNTSRVRGSSFSPERARQVIAAMIILLTLWGGGFGCLWCCASNMPDGCCDKRSAATVHDAKQSCVSHLRCCEPTEGDQLAALKHASQSTAAHCCLMGTQSDGPAALTPPFTQPTPGQAISPAPAPSLSPPEPPPAPHTPPANRGSTYLRCGVLLI